MSRLEWLPGPVRSLLRSYRHGPRLRAQQLELQRQATQPVRKVIIGSSGTSQPGWVTTDREVLDLLQEETWQAYFAPASLDAILAEHVWEHLPADGARIAAAICYRFLKPGGYLRVAVPDGLHPDRQYVDSVRPGGTGPGAHDHQVLYTHASLSDLFAAAGFDIHLREYFDAAGHFHCDDWDPRDGLIQRSQRFDERNSPAKLAYTSVILDARKPGAAGQTLGGPAR